MVTALKAVALAIALSPSLWVGPGEPSAGLTVSGSRQVAHEDSVLVLSRSVRVFRDVSNVGVVTRNGKALLIGSGDARILQAADRLGIQQIDWVLYTGHAREQTAGVYQLGQAGVRVGVPAGEVPFFERATEFWSNAHRRLEHRYTFRPDFMVLRESIRVDRQLQPDAVFQWEGIDFHVLGTPGRSDGAVSYVFELDGRTFAFTGDLIYGPGQIRDLHGLQKRLPGMPLDYWGFGGAVPEVIASLKRVLARAPDLLVPAHGVVMSEPVEAVALLEERLEALMRNYLGLAGWRIFGRNTPVPYDAPMLQPLPGVDLPSWIHRGAGTSWYLSAEDGSVFLFDAGVPETVQAFDTLRRDEVITRVDGIWISHYHDDHVESVNWFRFMDGATVYAQKQLVDVLENPRAYSLPAQASQPVRVDHALGEGETIRWKGFELTGYHFPGQTLYHGGLLIEHDGTRVFHVGDSFNNWGIEDHTSHNRNLLGAGQGYEQCLRLLLDLKPDLLLASHWGALPISESYLQRTLELLEERRRLLDSLIPGDHINFGLDPYWARAYPYRQTVLPGALVTLEARILNHAAAVGEAFAELRLPPGWRAQQESASASIPGKSEGVLRLTAFAPSDPRQHRDVLGIWLRFNGRELGEIAEAIIEYYGECCGSK
jgi:glyoxylase-like metal-dependent hydrolase (beta-lactamase superfamily II)